MATQPDEIPQPTFVLKGSLKTKFPALIVTKEKALARDSSPPFLPPSNVAKRSAKKKFRYAGDRPQIPESFRLPFLNMYVRSAGASTSLLFF